MNYKTVTSGIPFIRQRTVRDFSDTDYNAFIDMIKRVEYKGPYETPSTLLPENPGIRFYVDKDNINFVANMVRALHPEFMSHVKKTINWLSGNNRQVVFRTDYNNKADGQAKCREWVQKFQLIKANGKIVRYDKTNPLKGYTQNGTVVPLTAANDNLTWLKEQQKITDSSTTVDSDGNNYDIPNIPAIPGTGGKSNTGGNGMNTNTLLMLGAGALLLFLLLRRKNKQVTQPTL